MTRLRRGMLLALLAGALGFLAASDVAEREAAMREQLAPLVEVAVARRDLETGRTLAGGDLATRQVPARFAPTPAEGVPELVGRELAVPLRRGADVQEAHLRDDAALAGAMVAPGERAAEVTGTGSAELILPGTQVDVLVVDEGDRGGARVALAGAEVLAVRAAEAPEAATGQPAVTATLRVSVREAVALAAAEAGARAVRLLARPQ